MHTRAHQVRERYIAPLSWPLKWAPTDLVDIFSRANALKELEEWFEARASKLESLDSHFARAENLQSRRLKREMERRECLSG